MRRNRTHPILTAFIGLMLCCFARTAAAEKLELGINVTPTFMHDKNAEAVSSENLVTTKFGVDLRSEVYTNDTLSLTPLIAYRFGRDYGTLFNSIDSDITTHDILAGVRLRHGLISWLTVFIEIEVGAQIAKYNAAFSDWIYESRMDDESDYKDTAATWSAGGLIGIETHLSRKWLKSRGKEWFCFGGEIAFGYRRNGNLDLHPKKDADPNSIETVSAGGFGDLNLSGMVLQIGANLYFF